MMDKIEELIYTLLSSERGKKNYPVSNCAKQIRQQIGRELLEKRRYTGVHGFCVSEEDIREVCQLGEEE